MDSNDRTQYETYKLIEMIKSKRLIDNICKYCLSNDGVQSVNINFSLNDLGDKVIVSFDDVVRYIGVDKVPESFNSEYACTKCIDQIKQTYQLMKNTESTKLYLESFLKDIHKQVFQTIDDINLYSDSIYNYQLEHKLTINQLINDIQERFITDDPLNNTIKNEPESEKVIELNQTELNENDETDNVISPMMELEMKSNDESNGSSDEIMLSKFDKPDNSETKQLSDRVDYDEVYKREECELRRLVRQKKSTFEFICHCCNTVYLNKKRLIEHLTDKQYTETTKCIMCKETFHDFYSYNAHQCRFSCIFCAASKCIHRKYLDDYRNTIYEHLTMKCMSCNYIYNSKFDYLKHVNESHSKYTREYYPMCKTTIAKKQICTHCGKFLSKTAIQAHMKFIGMKRCDICKRSMRAENYESHMEFHNGLREQKQRLRRKVFCDMCGFNCSKADILENHKNRVHYKIFPYRCSECEKCFASPNALKTHQRTHDQTKLICDICGKELCSKFAMIIHMRIHTLEKPYQCDVCDMKFKTNFQRMRHHKVVHDEAKLKCKHCDKLYHLPDSLRKHELKHKVRLKKQRVLLRE